MFFFTPMDLRNIENKFRDRTVSSVNAACKFCSLRVSSTFAPSLGFRHVCMTVFYPTCALIIFVSTCLHLFKHSGFLLFSKQAHILL